MSKTFNNALRYAHKASADVLELLVLHSVRPSTYICGLLYFLVEETRADELNRFFLLPACVIPVCHLTDQNHTLRAIRASSWSGRCV